MAMHTEGRARYPESLHGAAGAMSARTLPQDVEQPPAQKPVGDIAGAVQTAMTVSAYAGELADRAEAVLMRLLGSLPQADGQLEPNPLPNGAMDEALLHMRSGIRSLERIGAALRRLENALEG